MNICRTRGAIGKHKRTHFKQPTAKIPDILLCDTCTLNFNIFNLITVLIVLEQTNALIVTFVVHSN